jgi:hypothetical protein
LLFIGGESGGKIRDKSRCQSQQKGRKKITYFSISLYIGVRLKRADGNPIRDRKISAKRYSTAVQKNLAFRENFCKKYFVTRQKGGGARWSVYRAGICKRLRSSRIDSAKPM